MMVTLLVMEMFSIGPLMFTTVPGGSGVAVGDGIGLGVVVGVVVEVGAIANASTTMLRANSAPSAVNVPWMCARAPWAGVPAITVCASKTTGVPATTQRS